MPCAHVDDEHHALDAASNGTPRSRSRRDQACRSGGGCGLSSHPDVLRLDRDATLTLEVHRVEVLRPHVAHVDRSRQLEDAIRQRRLAVVDVSDDREVAECTRDPWLRAMLPTAVWLGPGRPAAGWAGCVLRLGQHTATQPDALPSEASRSQPKRSGGCDENQDPVRPGSPCVRLGRRTAAAPDALPSEASRSQPKRRVAPESSVHDETVARRRDGEAAVLDGDRDRSDSWLAATAAGSAIRVQGEPAAAPASKRNTVPGLPMSGAPATTNNSNRRRRAARRRSRRQRRPAAGPTTGTDTGASGHAWPTQRARVVDAAERAQAGEEQRVRTRHVRDPPAPRRRAGPPAGRPGSRSAARRRASTAPSTGPRRRSRRPAGTPRPWRWSRASRRPARRRRAGGRRLERLGRREAGRGESLPPTRPGGTGGVLHRRGPRAVVGDADEDPVADGRDGDGLAIDRRRQLPRRPRAGRDRQQHTAEGRRGLTGQRRPARRAPSPTAPS